MSADPMRKQSKLQNYGHVILPQAINDPSIIESVAGFIHDVVPQAYSSVLPGESRDPILWARFDSTDYNDPENFLQLSESENYSTAPLLLVLGYSTGAQVWSVPVSGEASEVFTWCQGTVRTLRFLQKPLSRDPLSSKRPIAAIVDSSSPGPPFSTISFISIRTGEMAKMIKFSSQICDVQCNRKSVVVTFNERIAVFDSATLEDRLTITTCYLSPGNSPNPVALGTRWLAYGEKRLTTWQRSSGGCEGDGAQSYTSTVIHAAKSLSQGLLELRGTLTGSSSQSSPNAHAQPGIVSVVDIERKVGTKEEERGNVIAHFLAHTSAVVSLAFDPSGLLLITADKHGHNFNVFRIHPHPCTSQLAAVHHLYILHRGETTARVQDIAVSWDSRWVAVSTVRGTTHIFPITPYGGLVTVRTHATSHVANKLSTFERSAGLIDGRGSPLLPNEVPPTSPSPRLPPYPHPSIITAMAQIKARLDDCPLAATFAPPRAWIPGKPKSKRTCADSIYIISNSGTLLQHDLDPKCVPGVPKDKISFDTSIEVGVEAKAEWVLSRPPYMTHLSPPLPPDHVFLDLPPRPQPPPDKWLSQVEMVSHTGPHRRLWMGPQFCFKVIDPLPPVSGNEESGADVNPLRSNPINMPMRPFFYGENNSGGSVGSPQFDSDDVGGRLKEDLADAMLETHFGSGQARGKLRKAEVEWQVNPLGAVQTHPVAVATHWTHPFFYEPFPVNLFEEECQDESTTTQSSVTDIKTLDTCSDETASNIQLESIERDLLMKHCEELPSSDSDFSKHDGNVTNEYDCESYMLKYSDNSLTTQILPELFNNKLVPIDESIKVQSEVISLDEEDTTNIKKSKVKLNELEEKSSKTTSRKGRKKRNGNDKKGKKDTSKSFQMDDHDSALLSVASSSPKIDEIQNKLGKFISPTINVYNTINIVEEENSEQMLLSTEVESTIKYDIMDENILIPTLPDSEIQSYPIEEELLELGQDNIPDIIQSDEKHFSSKEEEVPECGEVTSSQQQACNECIEPELIKETDSESIEILVDDNQYNVEVDIDENLESGANLPSFASELTSSVDLVAQILIDFDEAPIPSIVHEEIELTCTNETKNVIEDNSQSTVEILRESDMNGNTRSVDINEKQLLTTFDILKDVENTSAFNDSISQEESSRTIMSSALEDSSDSAFITVPYKSGRNNKNKRKKKEKLMYETSQLPDIIETDPSDLVSSKTQETTVCMDRVPTDVDTNIENEAPTLEKKTDMSHIIFNAVSVEEDIQEKDNQSTEVHSVGLMDSIKSISPICDMAPLFSEDIQSDLIASTDRSEVEDISSHSGKESDDSKINKKERSRKPKRSDSSEKDRSDSKKKSPSPAAIKTELNKDSESSDEFSQVPETVIPKIPKRKKGKKSEDNFSEIIQKMKEGSTETIGSLIRGPKDKSSDSSNEHSSETILRRHHRNRSWSNAAGCGGDQRNSVDDRDSVYESCNDDGASDSLAFESSKEDFDESALKVPVVEVTSSNTEDKTDSSDKVNQPLSKKIRKQKKKKR